MAATLENQTATTALFIPASEQQFLQRCAEATSWDYLVDGLPKHFPDLVTVSTQQALNDLNVKIITPTNRDLEVIALFKRAMANYNALAESMEAKDKAADPVTSYYAHHAPLSFTIPKIDLTLNVQETEVEVVTEMTVERKSTDASLILDAKNHKVLEVSLNGEILCSTEYTATLNEIIIHGIPSSNTFKVKIRSQIDPFNNKTLEGMYLANGILTTQCESEGARRIFPTIDRPDVLSKITTTIHADAHKYPIVLSNGNLSNVSGSLEHGQTVVWDDPFPKPSYLFASVLGDLERVCDTYKTRSGKTVSLEVYVEPGKTSKASYALYALRKAMEFDEKYFDREYDLDSLKMVAIPNFNAGAMENKGLMIFNDIRLLVDSSSGTDSDFRNIAAVVAHEYFHNWSGNRVTIRNWFEIALKEAFTDLRAMLFTVWLFGEEYIRPKDILTLWEAQFPEDASEKAHPLVVQSYVDAHSIYDHTTYTKGREVFRTLQGYLDWLVPDGFKNALNHYFEHNDGKAVTFKELLKSCQTVLPVGQDLNQFERWFHQAGTPTVNVSVEYDAASEWANIVVTQSCPDPKTGNPQPALVIPFSVELMGADGKILVARDEDMVLNQDKQSFGFYVKERPIPIVMHGYSAPVKLECDYTKEDMACLVLHSKDTFTRWNAGRSYTMRTLKDLMDQQEQHSGLTDLSLQLYVDVLKDPNCSPLAKVQLLQIPSIRSMSQELKCYDFKKLKELRSLFTKQLALACKRGLEQLFKDHAEPVSATPNEPASLEMQIRELRNACRNLLAKIDPKALDDVYQFYAGETNFNNSVAAFNILINSSSDKKEAVSEDFYNKWKDTPAVFNNWLIANAGSATCTVADLKRLEKVEGFKPDNSNHLRSLYRVFCNNLGCYHDDKGEGYKFIVDKILEIASFNPLLANNYIAADAFIDFENLPASQQALMAAELQRLAVPQVPEQIRDFATRLLKKKKGH